MEMSELLVDAFGRIKQSVHSTVDGLSEDELAFRPSPEANSIGWLVWHIARSQGSQISRLDGHEQIWLSKGWASKFNLPFDETATGYGQTSVEVAAVRASTDQLLGYYDAVHDQTIAYINKLTPKDYQRVVDTSWNPPVTLAIRIESIINDNTQHAGQAAYIRGLLPKR